MNEGMTGNAYFSHFGKMWSRHPDFCGNALPLHLLYLYINNLYLRYKRFFPFLLVINLFVSFQVVRMLIVIVTVFATMWLPYRVMVVYNSFAKEKYYDMWFLLFCRVMVYINSAINPILYNAMSAKFRREFQKILCCGM